LSESFIETELSGMGDKSGKIEDKKEAQPGKNKIKGEHLILSVLKKVQIE
jgi:hypothetical protein